ncbi:transposase [Microseira wollei NIES-4236]|uniref:Transposase n=1 Tax=Microseira wollei NIES-4236 TaxID=2530354 RepID=A0AAV3XCM1_9CYAN|nr:transposase [Microseira wollei NIES-4236]
MVKVIAAEKKLQTLPGIPSKLSIPEQILMTLIWREYPTYFHWVAGGLTQQMLI